MGNLAVALRLARAGFSVFPCHESGKRRKAPYTPNGHLDATTDPQRIRSRWRKWPHAIVGLWTGSASDVAVLDLDRKDGKDGVAELRERGLLPRSGVIVTTPTGGRHLYFAHPDGLTCSTSKIAPGVDVKAEGGYVIAPGSVMADGSAYEYERGNLVDTTLPAWPRDRKFQPRRREPVIRSGKRKPLGLSIYRAWPYLKILTDDAEWRDKHGG